MKQTPATRVPRRNASVIPKSAPSRTRARFGIDAAPQHKPGLEAAYGDVESLKFKPVKVKLVECELPSREAVASRRRAVEDKLKVTIVGETDAGNPGAKA